MNDKPQQRLSIIWLLIMVVIVATLMWSLAICTGAQPEKVSYSQFLIAVNANKVEQAQIGETEIRWKAAGSEDWVITTRIPNVEDTETITKLQERGVEISGRTVDGVPWISIIGWLLPLGLLFFLWFFMIRRMGVGGGQDFLSIGRSGARVFDMRTSDVDFESVAGVDEAKAELQEVVDILRNPARYQSLGGRLPKGILIVGPPGTGKTLLARATAGEAGVPFYSISGSEFVQMFVGVGAARVRDLFDQAKADAPCLVFIDEIDAVGRLRAGATIIGGHEEREQTLNQLLTEMDGFDPSRGVIIMAATNRPDVLDPALLRPGRFDRQVVLDKPDMRGREAILKVHIRGINVVRDIDIHALAAITPGFAGAELANVVNEAALLAARHRKQVVEMVDMEEAIDRVMTGLERKSRILSDEEKNTVAHHEMGHALVAMLLPHTEPVRKVSIIPRGVAALGMTLQLPLQDKYLFSREELKEKIAVMMGGRIAEELCIGRISTGAQDDLYHATQLARRMVIDFGMSDELGPLAFGDGSDPYAARGPGVSQEKEYSEETARLIDAEVKSIVEQNYQRARRLLEENAGVLETLAQELKEEETLEGADLKRRLEELQVESKPSDIP